ncbi:S1/P1 nuclease [Sabulilitoribacter multivorans]|uniref:S1/P1 nuclease n=1 Tax=Flaviramulus multivorans TaxID=1304750 RepID=A0ABS9IHF4_9FLAO|nr:S1/P1 nuclease [Flaviramulus multivorans]MCF7560191.1 S1/P1 nuclease [Flaviramulus multivorans]
MKPTLILVFTLFFTFFQPIQASPKWGATGHRVVGEIANQYLNYKTKKEVQRLLKRESLAFVSTFADEIKSDDRYKKYYTWHYINMPLEADYDASKQHPDGDLVSGIAYCQSVIKNKQSSDDDKAFYLKLLIHLIGDLHQPMHIGLEEDRGGNDFKVQWFYNETNLHSVWDSKMIDDYGMSYTELANNADYVTKSQIKAIQKGSIIDWVNETHQLTRKVYNNVQPNENLRYRYSYQNFNTVRSQLQIAGIRLAKVLNDLF